MPTVLDHNPLAESTAHGKDSRTMHLVIFGASGDLTKRKLIPAIFDLARQALLPRDSQLLALGVQRWTTIPSALHP